MKVRVPKEYKALPKKQKEIVCDYLKEVAIEEALKSYNRDLGIALEQYANAITTVQKDSLVGEPSLRIRKLTPKECFRLMGFDDESFHKAEAVNSNTQLYKQAGNSIGVPVVEYIIKALLECGALKNEL